MFKRYLVAGLLFAPPGTEGTTENVAGAQSTGATSSGNVTSGTASEAMIKAATAASSAEPVTAPAVTPKAGDTSQAAGTGTPGVKPAETGQLQQTAVTEPPVKPAGTQDAPELRIQAATKNARASALKEYGIPSGMSAEDVKNGIELLAEIRKDPKAFFRDLAAQLGETLTAPAVQADETYPEPDLVDPSGKIKTYSVDAFQKALGIHGKKVQAQLMAELKPALDFFKEQKADKDTFTMRQETRQRAASVIKEAQAWPHFTENEAAIGEKLDAMDKAEKARLGPEGAMYKAYNLVLAEKVFPGIQTAAEKRVREQSAKQQAAGTGTAHPTDQGGTVTKASPQNVTQLARHMEEMAAAATATV